MTETEFEVPDGFDPETETPDVDDLLADEPNPEAEVVVPDDVSEDELRKLAYKAQKQARFEREQRVKAETRNWRAEAAEHYPYADLDTITAESRRAFLEAAKQDDQRFRERAKDLISENERTREEIKAEVEAEVEARYADGWGKPFTAGGGPPVEGAETEERLSRARRQKSLVGVTKALMDGRRI